MPVVAWDRLLETCYRQGVEVAILMPGSPPLLRVGNTFRSLSVPALDVSDIAAMASEQLANAPEYIADDYRYVDFWYGNVAYFRVMVFGYPNTKALVLSRCTPPGANSRASQYKFKWKVCETEKLSPASPFTR